MRRLLIVILALILSSNVAFAHPGRTDSNGGHTCYTKCEKWGLKQSEYHFHTKEIKTAITAKLESRKCY